MINTSIGSSDDAATNSTQHHLLEGTVSGWILSKIQILDNEWGAYEWDPIQIAVATVVVLGAIRVTWKDFGGVTWWCLIHAIVTAYGSLACVWLNVNAAEAMTGTPEPMRSLSCQGPLTSLHRIIPAITMGFGVYDVVEGFSHGIDFILHGLATFSVMAYFCYYDIGELIVPMLLMEVSTVHLNLTKAKFLSETAKKVNMMLFAITFFAFRLFVCPYLWYDIMKNIYYKKKEESIENIQSSSSSSSSSCLPWHFPHIVLCFGLFYHTLNAYWGYKIILKLRREMMKNKVKEA